MLQSLIFGQTVETFGEWLRRQRQERQLTREQLAQRVGCSAALLRKIEDGERRPSTQVAELLANALNVPLAERATFVKVARGELGTQRLSQAPDLSASSESALAPALRRVNLPVLPTPLIGRQREVGELLELLRDPQCRLLTLVGPGGMGKTRLAIETASQVQADFAHGVYFVPLTAVNTARSIVPVLADAIGFPFASTAAADPKAQLWSYLREKQALLLLDNLEQLLAEPGIEVLADLLANAPRVKLLATSREALGLQGEWVFEVQGLPVPEPSTAAVQAPGTAVELFLQRTRRVQVGFTATAADFPAIVRICRLVDGMPLGIELAATWVRTLACDDIAAEIEHGLDFLSVSARDLPARHRSMRAVFEHSWRQLTAEEQQCLLRLSVLRGGFRREAAEQVAQATLAMLSALVTKSLLRRSGDDRYDLHELIRLFAAEHFRERPAEQVQTQARCADYYLDLLSRVEPSLHGAAQPQTLAELTAEAANIRAGWAWAVEQGQFARIAQSMRAFEMLYDTRSWWQEGLEALEQAISALEAATGSSAPDTATQTVLGQCLAAYGMLSSRLGKFEQARAKLEHSLAILRPLNQPRALVEAVTYLGTVMELTGDYRRAGELYAEGQALATAAGDQWFAALGRTLLIGLAGFTDNRAAPQTTFEGLQAAVADWRRLGDPRFTAMALNSLSLSAVNVGQYETARAALEESLALTRAVGDRWGLGFAYRGLGLIAQAQGEHGQAVTAFRQSLDTLTELGARSDVARLLAEMGRSLLALGYDAEAEQAWRDALRLSGQTHGHFVALAALTGMAGLEVRRGSLEKALAWLLMVVSDPASLPDTRERAMSLRAGLEARLTPAQVATAQARAETQTLEGATAEILDPADPVVPT